MFKALNLKSLNLKSFGIKNRAAKLDRKQVSRLEIKPTPYLPDELVGGSVPFIAGKEEEAVWKAASQACATEKVHFVYGVEEKRCWYIACPSAVLASEPDSWCPLAAALPGCSEFWDKETVYLYEQDGRASALKWDAETGRLQVFTGAARTLLSRMQSMDANLITVNGDSAKPVPWRNRALMSEKLSRDTAWLLVVSGLLTSMAILIFLGVQLNKMGNIERDLEIAKTKADEAARDLIIKSHEALHSEPIMHMVRIQELLKDLNAIDGTLEKYEVNGDKLVWEVLIAEEYKKGTKSIRGDIQQGTEKDGLVRMRGTD
jgi:hypothetical protein